MDCDIIVSDVLLQAPGSVSFGTRRVLFSNSKGFNYLQFLEELQPSEKLKDKY